MTTPLIVGQLSQQVRSQILLKSLRGGSGPDTANLANSGDALCFFPGRRTRDDGSLGVTEGRVTLKTMAPLAGQEVRWRILSPEGGLVDDVVTSAPHEIDLLAARPGRFRLEVGLANTALEPFAYEISAPAFLAIDLRPDSIGVILDELGVAADAGQRQALADDLVAVARKVATHALRPVNVRLLWPGDDVPGHFIPSAPRPGSEPDFLATSKPIEKEADGNIQRFYPGLRFLHVAAPLKVLPNVPALEKLSDILDARLAQAKDSILAELRARLGTRLDAAIDVLGDMFLSESVDAGWGYSGLLEIFGVGQVLFGGGVRQFDGTAVGDGSSVAHRVLATLADAAKAAGWAPGDAATGRYLELAGRMLGTQIAVAALRMTGLRAGAVGLPDTEEPGQTLHTDLLDPAPSAPERDFLGLYRPEEADVPKSLDHLGEDLRLQANPPDAARWVDLCATVATPTAALIGGEPTTKYDALAGLVSERSLLAVRGLTGTLPAPYGPYTLRWGDRDRPASETGNALPVYGGKTFGAGERPEETREIELLQADLLRVGITLGQRTAGKYGFRKWTSNDDKWDGTLGASPVRVSAREPDPDRPGRTRIDIATSRPRWNALCDGDASTAVREFQIASTYPQAVMEKVSPEPVLVKRLRVTAEEERARPEGDALGQPNVNVNGMLSPAMADSLRNWVFTRRRIPAIVIGGAANNPYAEADATRPFIQNVMSAALDAHPRISSAYRFYSVDRTGRFGGTEEPVVLGRPSYSDRTARLGYWGGLWHPTNGEMSTSSFTPANSFGPVEWQLPADLADEERQRRERRRGAFRIVAALARVESIEHWDGFNAWDDAIFSWPPFHFTLTLGANGGDGGSTCSPNLMGAVIEFMRNPPQDVLDGAYPTPAPTGDTDADAAAERQAEARREALKTRMRECYWDNFGVYGLGASAVGATHSPGSFVTLSGLIDASDTARNVRMDQQWVNGAAGRPQQALYQAYQQWFRSWNWGQRFALHLRNMPLLRTMTFAYALHWAHAVLDSDNRWARDFGIATDANAVLRSERARAVYLRLYIRAPGHTVSARRALGRLRGTAATIADFHRNTTEQRIVDAIVNSVTGGVHTTAETARDHVSPDGLGQASLDTDGDNAAADLSQVRNELLRDVMNVDWADL